MRILICFSYNGFAYCGYQRQNNATTVQQTIEDALSQKLNQQIKLTATGRTDAGVHALCQYAHFDADIKFEPGKIVNICKSVLPDDIKVFLANQVPDDFHARKNVRQKTYLYVFNKNANLIPFLNKTTAFLDQDVDIELMVKTSKKLIGKHNFKAFCSAKTEITDFERTIYDIKIEDNEDYLTFKISGNGFLYNMVRIIVGTLMDIAKHKLMPEIIDKMLESGDRTIGGKTAKPQGLYLYNVEY